MILKFIKLYSTNSAHWYPVVCDLPPWSIFKWSAVWWLVCSLSFHGSTGPHTRCRGVLSSNLLIFLATAGEYWWRGTSRATETLTRITGCSGSGWEIHGRRYTEKRYMALVLNSCYLLLSISFFSPSPFHSCHCMCIHFFREAWSIFFCHLSLSWWGSDLNWKSLLSSSMFSVALGVQCQWYLPAGGRVL